MWQQCGITTTTTTTIIKSNNSGNRTHTPYICHCSLFDLKITWNGKYLYAFCEKFRYFFVAATATAAVMNHFILYTFRIGLETIWCRRYVEHTGNCLKQSTMCIPISKVVWIVNPFVFFFVAAVYFEKCLKCKSVKSILSQSVVYFIKLRRFWSMYIFSGGRRHIWGYMFCHSFSAFSTMNFPEKWKSCGKNEQKWQYYKVERF